jgi:glycosyltransferase involved in cell wall biosynthesis
MFVWGGRISAAKGLDTSLELADMLYRSGVPVVFEAHAVADRCMVGDKIDTLASKYPFLHMHVNTPQVDFWAACKAADVFLTASKYESYGLSYMECLRCGVPVVFFDRPWVHAIVPDWYPYIVKSKNEAFVLLKTLHKNRTHASGAMHELQKFIFSAHNRGTHCSHTVDAWIALAKSLRTHKKPRDWNDVFESSA